MKKLVLSYIWAILWMILVVTLCILPPQEFDKAPSYPGMDKLVHTGFFFVFSVLIYSGTIRLDNIRFSKWTASVLVIGLSLVLALLTEGLQEFIFTYRSGDLWDIFADAVGTGMAIFAYLLLYRQKI